MDSFLIYFYHFIGTSTSPTCLLNACTSKPYAPDSTGVLSHLENIFFFILTIPHELNRTFQHLGVRCTYRCKHWIGDQLASARGNLDHYGSRIFVSTAPFIQDFKRTPTRGLRDFTCAVDILHTFAMRQKRTTSIQKNPSQSCEHRTSFKSPSFISQPAAHRFIVAVIIALTSVPSSNYIDKTIAPRSTPSIPNIDGKSRSSLGQKESTLNGLTVYPGSDLNAMLESMSKQPRTIGPRDHGR